MPRTFDVGPFYCHGLRYPFRGAPAAERAWTTEIEPPYRRGDGWAFRIGPRRAVVVGKWTPTGRTEDEALVAALGARAITKWTDDGVEYEEWPCAPAEG